MIPQSPPIPVTLTDSNENTINGLIVAWHPLLDDPTQPDLAPII